MSALAPMEGFTQRRFVAVVQVDVSAPPDWTAADAEKWAREQLQDGPVTDPGDEFTVLSMTEVAR